MGLRIEPLWDPTGTVSVEVDDYCHAVVVTALGEELRFTLREDRPERLGWVEQRLEQGRVRRRRVAVGERWSCTACASGTPSRRCWR